SIKTLPLLYCNLHTQVQLSDTFLQRMNNLSIRAVWFDNYDATGVNFSAIGGAINKNTEKDLDVFYASLSYDLLENLNIGIDYVNGKNKVKDIPSRTTTDIDFYEITPNFTWGYNENLEIYVYYAFLKTERSGNYISPQTDSEDRNQFKVEIVYAF
ncbi:MAG: major outer membrane protein, partial [Helicobacter sp.]|nr:major outer membrane protein [Helicobacter sp.]